MPVVWSNHFGTIEPCSHETTDRVASTKNLTTPRRKSSFMLHLILLYRELKDRSKRPLAWFLFFGPPISIDVEYSFLLKTAAGIDGHCSLPYGFPVYVLV